MEGRYGVKDWRIVTLSNASFSVYISTPESRGLTPKRYDSYRREGLICNQVCDPVPTASFYLHDLELSIMRLQSVAMLKKHDGK